MATTKTFKTTGMHCPSCSMLITMNLEDLDGVTSVDCNHATGDTRVTFEEGVIDASKVRQAIVEAGYQAELVA